MYNCIVIFNMNFFYNIYIYIIWLNFCELFSYRLIKFFWYYNLIQENLILESIILVGVGVTFPLSKTSSCLLRQNSLKCILLPWTMTKFIIYASLKKNWLSENHKHFLKRMNILSISWEGDKYVPKSFQIEILGGSWSKT